MYHIVADSGCDIFKLDGASFSTAPLTINTDGKSYLDDEKMDTSEMIRYLLSYKGRSSTACPSGEAWLRAFDMEDGSAPDELYIVTLTSALSGTYNSACVAKNLYLEKHPDIKTLVIDSLSVGPEMRLILEKIVELKKSGCSFEDVSKAMKDYCASTRLFFAFKSLHNLAENGRVSKLAAAAAGVLNISVYGTASVKGEIEPLGKARGEKRVIASLTEKMIEAGYKGGKVHISHTENADLAAKIQSHILSLFPSARVTAYPVRGLCSYYCERGGVCIGCETES